MTQQRDPTAGGPPPTLQEQMEEAFFRRSRRRRLVGRGNQPRHHQFQTGGPRSGIWIRDGRKGTRALATTTTFHTTPPATTIFPKRRVFFTHFELLGAAHGVHSSGEAGGFQRAWSARTRGRRAVDMACAMGTIYAALCCFQHASHQHALTSPNASFHHEHNTGERLTKVSSLHHHRGSLRHQNQPTILVRTHTHSHNTRP